MMLQVCAPSLELRQEMRMELRQEAQLRLEQRLEQVQEMKQQLTLQQYLTFLEPFKELFDWCEKNKSSLRRFNNFGFDFNYHQIPLEVARRAGGYLTASPGWFIRLENGQPFKLTIEGIVPDWMLPFVALHERGEEISSGDHFFASKLEFAGVEKARKTTIYTGAIDRFFPGKFVDLLQPIEFDIPEEITEKAETQEDSYKIHIARELSTARRLVQDFFLPAPVSEKAIQYLQFNERIEERIKRLSETCQRIFFERQLETNNEITRAVMQMEREVNGSLANIPEECFRVARHHLMREYGLHFERIVSENFSRMYGERGYSFHIEGDLISAITKAKAIETAVRYTLPK